MSASRMLFIVALLGTACASGQRPAAGPDPADQLAASERALARELAAAEAEAHPVDCGHAGLLRDNICALAERICSLSPATDRRCREARASCQSARTRVAAACGKGSSAPPSHP
jgi:hypothetical protein